WRNNLADNGLWLGVLLAMELCFLLVGQSRGHRLLRIHCFNGTPEMSLVVVVVGLAVRGGQQRLDELRLVLTNIVQLRLCSCLVGLSSTGLDVVRGKFLHKLVYPCLLLDTVFAEKIDRPNAARL